MTNLLDSLTHKMTSERENDVRKKNTARTKYSPRQAKNSTLQKLNVPRGTIAQNDVTN
jgi:hypothetical protein